MLQYVTTNPGKLREAREYLGETTVAGYNYDYTEIQSPSLDAIAAHGAREAYREVGGPVVVDDAGLFITALDGFPGPYSAYVDNTLGIDRVWQLGAAESDQRASFQCVLAYCDGEDFTATPDPVDRNDSQNVTGVDVDMAGGAADGVAGDDGDNDPANSDSQLAVKLFRGTIRGTLVAPRGDDGFGYDPIFEHNGKTFAEMSTEEKNALSHRGRALAAFAEWFDSR